MPAISPPNEPDGKIEAAYGYNAEHNLKSMSKRTRSGNPRPKGYDFGKETVAAVVASTEFIQSLSRAEISACVYGSARFDALASTLPLMSVLGTKEEPLAAAFREFHRWSQD